MADDLMPDFDDGPDEYLDAPPVRVMGGGGGRGRASGGGGGGGGRVPPHNLSAEESLLGAMLLSRTAIDIASESLSSTDFYKPAHGHIYEAITSLSAQGELGNIRVFEFNNQGFLVSTMHARSGRIEGDESWTLRDVERREFDAAGLGTVRVDRTTHDSFRWPSGINTEMVSVALLKPERMRTTDLFAYIRHLEANGQTAQRHEIEFWRKVFYPLSCLVMVVLALPFAYLHFRSGSITGYVFGGVMIGISFFLLNNVFGYIGNLRNWWPWITAAAPGMIYSLLSLGAFGWLVLRR